MTQGKFKDRFTQHKHTFKNKSKSNAITLSAYTWDKQINTNTDIKWNIMKEYSCLPNKRAGTFIYLTSKIHPDTLIWHRYA